MAADPYAQHLQRAKSLFDAGEVLQAGQIWQAILKKQPDHAEARAGLLQVKRWMDARKDPGAIATPADAPPAAPTPTGPPPAAAAAAPLQASPEASATRVYKSTMPYKPVKPADAPAATGPEEPAAAALPMPAAAPPPAVPGYFDDLEPVERLLKEGCTLYDMGQVEDALRKWELILAQEPRHALANAYIAQARQELGYSAEAIPAIGVAPAAAVAAPAVGPEELLRRASQLYEMGSLEQSISTLEQLLQVDPGHADAQRFLALAQRELAESTPPTAPPPPPSAPIPLPPPPPPTALRPPPPPTAAPVPMPAFAAPTALQALPAAAPARAAEPSRPPEPPASPRSSGFISHPGRAAGDVLEQKLAQGERLLQLGRHEEASFAFQMALTLSPGDGRALDGLQRAGELARSVLPAATEATLSGVPGTLPAPAPPPVQPPASLTAPAAPARQGPALPRGLQDLGDHPLFGSNRFLVAGVGVIVLLGAAIQLLQARRKDERLRSAVASARQIAVAPAAQGGQPVELAESASALRQETETTVAFDPVRAYHRAKELLRRDPGDAVAAALLEKAQAALTADPVEGISLTEFQRLLAAGDLEGAERALDALLRAKPEDPDLLQRAARLERVLAGLHASKGEWGEAKTALQKGRALFPQDLSWQARIRLLERIQALPRAEQQGWLPFLG